MHCQSLHLHSQAVAGAHHVHNNTVPVVPRLLTTSGGTVVRYHMFNRPAASPHTMAQVSQAYFELSLTATDSVSHLLWHQSLRFIAVLHLQALAVGVEGVGRLTGWVA